MQLNNTPSGLMHVVNDETLRLVNDSYMYSRDTHNFPQKQIQLI